MEQQNGEKQDGESKIRITSGGKEYHERSSALLSKTFVDDPVFKFLLSSLPEPARLIELPKFMYSATKAAALNGAIFQEANDWSCTAIWVPPGKKPSNTFTLLQAGILRFLWAVGISGVKRVLFDFQAQTDACRARHLRDAGGKPIKRFYYLFFIATDFDARRQGLAREVVRRYQEIARGEGVPIWLEATTEASKAVYEGVGFEVVEEMSLGKGTHAESGVFEEGGKGGTCLGYDVGAGEGVISTEPMFQSD